MHIHDVNPLHKYILIKVLRKDYLHRVWPLQIVIPDSAEEELSHVGIVKAIGGEVTQVAVQDIVIFSINASIPLAGAILEPEGTYLMLNEKDIHCIVEDDEPHEQEAPKEEEVDHFGRPGRPR